MSARIALWALLPGLFSAVPAQTATPTEAPASTRSKSDVRQADELIEHFFTTLQAGKATGAIDDLFSANPLMSGRIAEKQQLVAQAESAIKIYGRLRLWERVTNDTLGTMVLRRYYIVQHDNMVTRWEFDLASLNGRWTVVYFGYNDQVQGWF